MAISSTTLTLSPQMNALAVMAQGQHDVLKEMHKTKEVFANYVNDSQETISSQAEEIQKLKAELASLNQMHAKEVTALKGAHEAEKANMGSAHEAEKANMGGAHAIEVAKYVAAAKVTSIQCEQELDPFITHKILKARILGNRI